MFKCFSAIVIIFCQNMLKSKINLSKIKDDSWCMYLLIEMSTKMIFGRSIIPGIPTRSITPGIPTPFLGRYDISEKQSDIFENRTFNESFFLQRFVSRVESVQWSKNYSYDWFISVCRHFRYIVSFNRRYWMKP